MRTARLARCSVPFAPSRGRGCGTSLRLTARCYERGAMELQHIERILSRSTRPQCTGRKSRRLRALLMRFWLAHPPLIRVVPCAGCVTRVSSAQSWCRLREKPSRARRGTACGLHFGKARAGDGVCERLSKQGEGRRVEERVWPWKCMVGDTCTPGRVSPPPPPSI
ncbi:hypothetical protein B0H13DRAFT_2005940 [Mycena leptocephala]|nr:hypothetical protein B0H13DRAFT_2005940 [Mycena leptocephala]